MVFGSDRPPDPDARLGAQIAANQFPGELSRRLAETKLYPTSPSGRRAMHSVAAQSFNDAR